MAQVLSALALSTKEMRDGRISGCIRSRYSLLTDYGTETFLRKLMGKTVSEGALRRLDALTNVGNPLVAARTLDVIHSVDGNVKATKELTHHMDQSVMTVSEVVCDIDGDVKPIKEPTHDPDQSRMAILIKDVTRDVGVDSLEVTEVPTHRANGNVKAIKGVRESGCSLLVDGYISHCFSPLHAERYFLFLLGSDNTIFYPNLSASASPNFEGTSFFISSVPRHISIQFPGQSRWVLDRVLTSGGTVVPQRMLAPRTVTDRRNHLEQAKLQLPIFFQCSDGTLGLSLEAAASGRCHGLVDAQTFAPLGLKSTTHIRIVVSDVLFCYVVGFPFPESANISVAGLPRVQTPSPNSR